MNEILGYNEAGRRVSVMFGKDLIGMQYAVAIDGRIARFFATETEACEACEGIAANAC